MRLIHFTAVLFLTAGVLEGSVIGDWLPTPLTFTGSSGRVSSSVDFWVASDVDLHVVPDLTGVFGSLPVCTPNTECTSAVLVDWSISQYGGFASSSIGSQDSSTATQYCHTNGYCYLDVQPFMLNFGPGLTVGHYALNQDIAVFLTGTALPSTNVFALDIQTISGSISLAAPTTTPEPASAWFLLSGFGMCVFGLRYRHNKQRTQS